jgi:5-hydroxyisourate hydrolase
MTTRSPITTHVLDTAHGRPAAGLAVTLYRSLDSDDWTPIGQGETDADGRIHDLLGPGELDVGVYRLRFDTAGYFATHGLQDYFYPWAEVVFRVDETEHHHHVALLLSPFGYSTYRG